MVDLKGPTLSPQEREILTHPLVGGVILFARNYEDPVQLGQLVEVLHQLRSPKLLVGVDQEGGSVQRFRRDFSPLPALGAIGDMFDSDRLAAIKLSEDCGWMMATELRASGVDFSFAPVLDVRSGVSQVIGNRAFHADPDTISWLAQAYIKGMSAAGMAAVGKHFPGHGSVTTDSHQETPVDKRDLADIRLKDLVPFERLVRSGLSAIMPAHVIYERVDAKPAGFSSIWLGEILRSELAFQGIIFSDDITMAGAAVAGGFPQRARAALNAGCDMVLVCNCPAGVAEVLDALGEIHEPLAQVRLMRMHGRGKIERLELTGDPRWQRINARVQSMNSNPELDLGDDEIV